MSASTYAAGRPSRRIGSVVTRLLSTSAFAVIAGGLAAPVLMVLLSLLDDASGVQRHIWSTSGPHYLTGTILLCSVVGLLAGVIGVLAAFAVSLVEFRMRPIIDLLLVLPLGTPPYLAAYAYGDIFGPFGAGTAVLQQVGIVGFNPRSLVGAATILAVTTYPYVYLLVRASLAGRSSATLEAARMLGHGGFSAPLGVLLPLCRPAIAGGVALAMMEAAGDYGVSDYFGVATLSTGIFRTWHGLGDMIGAAQLAAGLFGVALLLLMLEQVSRRGVITEAARGGREIPKTKLGRWREATLILALLAAPAIGLLVPVGFFLFALPTLGGAHLDLSAAGNSLMAGASGAVAALLCALAFAGLADTGSRMATGLARFATLGYALPGAVVALGVLYAGGAASLLAPWLAAGGFSALVYAYVVRFNTIAFNAIDAAFRQVNPNLPAAARLLGAGPTQTLFSIKARLAGPAIAAGVIAVFIDILKELPATLILRPFGFDTLATEAYRLASDERVREAAPHALMLITLGLSAVLVLNTVSGFRQRWRDQADSASSTISQI